MFFWLSALKKNFEKIWKIYLKLLTFAPAFENEASVFEVLVLVGVLFFRSASLSQESVEDPLKKKEKNFRKNLEDILKTPYLCNRFPLETGRRMRLRSLKELHKQYK